MGLLPSQDNHLENDLLLIEFIVYKHKERMWQIPQ